MVKIRKILVPLDGSQLSKSALPMAISLAKQYKAQIILLHALDESQYLASVPHPQAIQAYMQLMEDLNREMMQYLVDTQEELRQQALDVKVELVKQSAAEAIIERAARVDVDLVVMATHGRGGFARWTIGSVADKVLRYGPCPVLLVREGTGSEESMLAE